MRVLLFTQYYPPDTGAQAFRMEGLVKAFLKRNHRVSIITSKAHRYSLLDNKTQFNQYESNSNLEIYRLRSGGKNDIFWRRPVNYLLFMLNSLAKSLKLTHYNKSYNVIIATSPPITSALTAYICAFLRKKDFVLEVRDLWPETLVDLGIFKNKLIINILVYVEKILYKKAKLIIIVSKAFRSKISNKGIDNSKIFEFTNGLDKQFVLKDINEKEKKQIRDKYNIHKEKYVISYVGNVGISQHLKILVETAEKIKNDRLIFLIVGEGLEKKKLLKASKELGLESKIIFIEGVPRKFIKEIYNLSDILFLQLKDIEIFNRTIPSKIFEYLGSGKPIIYGLNGIAADILKESGNGIKIRPENSDDLKKAIDEITDNYEHYIEKAKKGREYVVKNYSKEDIMEKYVMTLENII
jgi:glycosyltransferase involved in cell wall biosynthesis